jgi:TetR/AcrR family transcriptional regulator
MICDVDHHRGSSGMGGDEILLAALRAFATRGYDGTSVRELNQQLGVSHNLLNRRFGSKEQLSRATVDRWIGEISPSWPQ